MKNLRRLDLIKRETEWLLRRINCLEQNYLSGRNESVDIQISLMDNFNTFQKTFKLHTSKINIFKQNQYR